LLSIGYKSGMIRLSDFEWERIRHLKTHGEQALRPRGKTMEGYPPSFIGHGGVGEDEFVTVVGLLVRERCFESKHDLVAARSVMGVEVLEHRERKRFPNGLVKLFEKFSFQRLCGALAKFNSAAERAPTLQVVVIVRDGHDNMRSFRRTTPTAIGRMTWGGRHVVMRFYRCWRKTSLAPH
jgi:hypothetical protein